MSHPVVHFEIITQNAGAAQAFYKEQFGWAINADNPLNYGATATGEGGINGGIANPYPGTDQTYVTFYIAVEDIAHKLKDLEAAGSSVVMPVMELPGGAKMAQIVDPFGSRIGLLQQG